MRRKVVFGLKSLPCPVAILRGETMGNIKEAIEAHLLALTDEKKEMPTEEEFVIGRVKVEVTAVG